MHHGQALFRSACRLATRSLSVARAIVAVAGSLSLDIIAEGIETQAEKAVLEFMGCLEGQGYLFARPLPSEDFVAWFDSNHKGNS